MADEVPLRLEWRTPGELTDNPSNWRTHPESQANAVTEVLNDVGWAGVCLYNEVTNRLIDGHLRKKVALARGDQKVPVLIGRWTEEQERKILLTLDPIAGMATASKQHLDALMRQATASGVETAKMLSQLAKDNNVDWAAIAQANPEIALGQGPLNIIEDVPPDPPANPVTKLGDLWLLGAYWQCENCGKEFSYDEGKVMGECPCG